ncbi:hypothetical protein C1H46_027381 [Malus baccata]|uniref:Uncharacterized protein n=1 Tax=Malus baccata TaxID=106549 RepID=A0A540LKP8_MALBA|nr:hypothetical protein C1H46_027381 [Malus baccata]
MDFTSFCNQRSPSSERLLDLFSFFPPSSGGGEKLNEVEVFWTTDFTKPAPDAPNFRLSLTRCINFETLGVLPEPVEKHHINDGLANVVDVEDEGDDKMLPSHELVARGSGCQIGRRSQCWKAWGGR